MSPPDMSIPAEFSIRGPHGTLPYVVLVETEEGVSPMLIWEQNQDAVAGRVMAHYRNPVSVRIFRAENPNHHIGGARVVPLSELA